MQSTFLLSCKYGKLAETTEWDKSLGERKIEGTRKQPHWRSKRGWKKSSSHKHYSSPRDIPEWRGRVDVMRIRRGWWVYVQKSDSETALM